MNEYMDIKSARSNENVIMITHLYLYIYFIMPTLLAWILGNIFYSLQMKRFCFIEVIVLILDEYLEMKNLTNSLNYENIPIYLLW